MGEERDEFPIGMRVLAVDDNMTCLRVLESKLRQCKYNVTITTEAIEALNMLKENKDNFDLIITDVHMPDMDGFKLLEQVGLTLDLPVIMLSGNDDPKTVMKGIEHGACDYLLKPARVEELKNIWQHVYRKKKSSSKEQNHSDSATSEDGQGTTNKKVNKRKRKEQNEDEQDDDEENTNENDIISKKKPRVAWTQELHQKFMDAIRLLGINKAVPKKILEIMNVEGLSRENVASHLQKYRLYLKKLEEKANLLAASGLRDAYLNSETQDNFSDFQCFASSSSLLSPLHSFQPNDTFNRKNSNIILGNNNLSCGIAQVGRPHNVCNPINDLGSQFHHGNLLQQMPTTLQKRILHQENDHLIGLQSSIYQTPFEGNNVISSNSNATYSISKSNAVPMTSGLSPFVTQINCNPSSSALVSPHNISSNKNDRLIDPITMLNGTNEGSNYLNFGCLGSEANQGQSQNIKFGSPENSVFGNQSIVDSTSSQSQRLNNGMYSNRAAMNVNVQTDYSNLLVMQQSKFNNSNVDNQLKNRDKLFVENSFFQGGPSSNGYSCNELDNMIISEQAVASSWMPEFDRVIHH